MNGSKPWYQSKTLLFNLVSALVAVAAELQPLVAESSAIQFPSWTTEVLVLVVVLGNVVLRSITSQAVTLKKGSSGG